MENQDAPTIPSTPDFDLRRVSTFFRKSLSNKDGDDQNEKPVNDQGNDQSNTSFDDVNLADYVEAYNELNKMFPKLGRLFSFISSDVGDKTRILSEHQSSPVQEKYKSVGSMLEYEKNEAKILETDKPHHHHLSLHHHHHLANGSRTLLRLHRALRFVVEFIDGVRQAGENDKMAHLARKAYDNTLSAYHPWLVRQGVHVAVYTLPNRQQLLTDLAGPNVNAEDAEHTMDEIVTTGRAVYEIVQSLYERHELLELP